MRNFTSSLNSSKHSDRISLTFALNFLISSPAPPENENHFLWNWKFQFQFVMSPRQFHPSNSLWRLEENQFKFQKKWRFINWQKVQEPFYMPNWWSKIRWSDWIAAVGLHFTCLKEPIKRCQRIFEFWSLPASQADKLFQQTFFPQKICSMNFDILKFTYLLTNIWESLSKEALPSILTDFKNTR